MKVFNVILNILLAVCALFLILVLVILVPKLSGYQIEVISSGEMAPAYQSGDIAYYKQTDFEDISEGDVIIFTEQRDNSKVLRKVVTKNELAKTFKTNTNENPDNVYQDPVSYQSVLGKISDYKLHNMGFILGLAQNKYVLFFIGIVVVLKLLFGSLKKPNKNEE